MLSRAGNDRLTLQTLETIGINSRQCTEFWRYSASPRRFKLSIGAYSLWFNHPVQVDRRFIHSKPVLHIVDLATHFSAATFLQRQTTSEIWRLIFTMCNVVYIGPPDYFSVDQGTAYTSHEMRTNLDDEGITLIEALIETPGKIGLVERYHARLRVAYNKQRAELDRCTSDAECLKMAVVATNSTIGPEGLFAILLVYWAIPRPSRYTPSLTQR